MSPNEEQAKGGTAHSVLSDAVNATWAALCGGKTPEEPTEYLAGLLVRLLKLNDLRLCGAMAKTAPAERVGHLDERGRLVYGEHHYNPPPNLTSEEREIIDHLAQAWNIFRALGDHQMHDKGDMRQAIDRAHDLIALRVARRVDPEVWR